MRGLVACVFMLLITGCSANPILMAWLNVQPAQPVALVGDATRGEELFRKGAPPAPPCTACHQTKTGAYGFSLGPNLDGIAERAGKRIESMSAEAYIHESIVDPHRFVVRGYQNIMYPSFAKDLTEQQIADLVAYLLTL